MLDAPERALERARVLRQRVADQVDWTVVAAGYSRLLSGAAHRA